MTEHIRVCIVNEGMPAYSLSALSPETEPIPNVFCKCGESGGAEMEFGGHRVSAHIWRVRAA
jgi:hypothetical protein